MLQARGLPRPSPFTYYMYIYSICVIVSIIHQNEPPCRWLCVISYGPACLHSNHPARPPLTPQCSQYPPTRLMRTICIWGQERARALQITSVCVLCTHCNRLHINCAANAKPQQLLPPLPLSPYLPTPCSTQWCTPHCI